MPDSDPNYVSRTTLQIALGISWTTLERWIRIYRCPVVTHGGQGEAWLFRLSDVLQFAVLRRLMPPAHKISLPCRDCGTWLHGLRAGQHRTGHATCTRCKQVETRRRELAEL
jgi:hypothetical protein